MDFTCVDTEVEAHEVVENWSVELHMDGLFTINHLGVWFYLAHSFNGEDVVIDTGTLNFQGGICQIASTGVHVDASRRLDPHR